MVDVISRLRSLTERSVVEGHLSPSRKGSSIAFMSALKRPQARRVARLFLLLLCAILLALYIASKIDFFTHYGTANYVREHSKYWAAMLALAIVIWLVERRFPAGQFLIGVKSR